MFLSKIHGDAQKGLFCRLYELYKKGLACLLHSPTIRPYVMKVLLNPKQYIYIDEDNPRKTALTDIRIEMLLHLELLNEKKRCLFSLPLDLHGRIRSLQTVKHLINFPLTQYQVVCLQKETAVFSHAIAFLLLNRWNNTCTNKLMYRVDKMSCNMLRLAARFGCFSNILYLAMYYYRTSRYMKALSSIEKTKVKLAQTHELYNSIDTEKFHVRALKQYYSAQLKQFKTRDIELHTDFYYIYELMPEQSRIEKPLTLRIPPLVMSYMLEILCSIHTDAIRAQRALDDLQALVHFDHAYVFEIHKDISWQILGICQQTMGDTQAALFSYQQSLIQTPTHGIQTVTLIRIRDIMTTAKH